MNVIHVITDDAESVDGIGRVKVDAEIRRAYRLNQPQERNRSVDQVSYGRARPPRPKT